jgi:hypothetical protein
MDRGELEPVRTVLRGHPTAVGRARQEAIECVEIVRVRGLTLSERSDDVPQGRAEPEQLRVLCGGRLVDVTEAPPLEEGADTVRGREKVDAPVRFPPVPLLAVDQVECDVDVRNLPHRLDWLQDVC